MGVLAAVAWRATPVKLTLSVKSLIEMLRLPVDLPNLVGAKVTVTSVCRSDSATLVTGVENGGLALIVARKETLLVMVRSFEALSPTAT